MDVFFSVSSFQYGGITVNAFFTEKRVTQKNKLYQTGRG
jgi:hypothetical protein